MNYLSNPNSLTGGPFGTYASSHNTGFFTDNTNPATTNCNVLPAPSSNIIAASGKWAGGKQRQTRKTRRRRRRRRSLGGKRKTKNAKRRKRRGGTTNNVPNTPSYATGTELPYNLSALANPAPYWKIDNCTDNYNHYTGGNRQSRRRHRLRRENRSSSRRKNRRNRGG